MWSTCSIATGHSWTQAPQVTQSQTTSSLTAFGTSGLGSKPAGSASRFGPSAEELVAEPHDQQLRRQLLARRVGRADVLAAAALGARHRVDHLLPRHVGDRVGAEAHRALVLDREVERLEPAARARAAEPDVDRRRRDVEVLRVRQVGEEADDEQDVRPDEDPLARLGPAALAEDLRDRVRDGRPRRRATRSGRWRSAPRARAAASARSARSGRG